MNYNVGKEDRSFRITDTIEIIITSNLGIFILFEKSPFKFIDQISFLFSIYI